MRPPEICDQDLIRQALGGSQFAFRKLMERHEGRMKRQLKRMLRNPEDVDDVFQEILIRVHKSLVKFRGDSLFSTWLYRVGSNLAKNFIRKKILSLPQLETEDEELSVYEVPDPTTPDSILESKQTMAALYRAIESLPEKLRTPLMLRDLSGLPYERIEKLTATTAGTVKNRIFRAREAVAEQLRGELETINGRW